MILDDLEIIGSSGTVFGSKNVGAGVLLVSNAFTIVGKASMALRSPLKLVYVVS